MAQDITQDLKHADLIGRLIVSPASNNRGDIPFGAVRAYESQSPNPLPISVGLDSMNRSPLH